MTPQAYSSSASPVYPPVAQASYSPGAARNEVVVKDIQMNFGSMVVFMLKWALAAIPAALILGFASVLIFAVLSAVFGAALAGLFHR